MLPARVVMNNSTLSVFKTDNYADITFTVNLDNI